MANNESFNLQRFIISIVIIGVVLVIGIYITSSIQDVTKVEDTAGVAVTNETVTFDAVNTAQNLAPYGLEDPLCTLTYVANQSTLGESLTSGNFTNTACTLLNASALNAAIGNGTVLVSYTYTYTATTDASNSAGDVVSALATGTSWISILVVVGFATIILTMLTSGLAAGAGRDSSTPYY